MNNIVIINASHYLREKAILDFVRDDFRLVFCENNSAEAITRLADRLIVTDLSEEPAAFKDIIEGLERQHIRPDAILTFSEYYVELVARLVEYFGLNGSSPTTAALCRDKYKMKSYLADKGISINAIKLATKISDIENFAFKHGYPIVIKPLNYGASEGVFKIENNNEIRDGFKYLENVLECSSKVIKKNSFLIEKYIPGKEYSVETLTLEKKHQIMAITEKYLGPEPEFGEIGHMIPAPLAESDRQKITQYIHQILEAFGVRYAITHTEIRLSPEPHLIEVALRPGGDLIMNLIAHSYGVRPYGLLVNAILGEDVLIENKHERPSMIKFLFEDLSKELADGYQIQNKIQRYPSVVEFSVNTSGEKRKSASRNWKNRIGYIIFSSDSYEQITREARELFSELTEDGVCN